MTYVRISIAGVLIGWGIGMAVGVFKDIRNETIMKAAVEKPIGNDKAIITEVE